MALKTIIYRGYTISKEQESNWIVCLNGVSIKGVESEDAALSWIDERKRSSRSLASTTPTLSEQN